MTVYDRIKQLAEVKNMTISSIEAGAQISNGSIVKWKSTMPKADNLFRVAQYLECSIEYILTGIETIQRNALSQNEQELLDLLHQFEDERAQIKFIGRVEALAKEMLDQ